MLKHVRKSAWFCGYWGDSQKACTCAPSVITKYQKRISGHLLDRIDIHIEVPRVGYEKLRGNKLGESSAGQSPHPQVIAHHRGSSGEQRNSITPSGGGTAISSEVDDGLMGGVSAGFLAKIIE
jgi:magnesium chelatase family protein